MSNEPQPASPAPAPTPAPAPAPAAAPERDNAFKPVWGLLAILVVVATIMGVRTLWRPEEIVPWRTDLPAASAEANQTHKPRLLYFTATWCGPCQEMRHTTWADKRVAEALQAYVPIKVDIDQHQDLARQYAIEAVPTLYVVDAAGKVQKGQTGAVDAETFIAWLEGSGFTDTAVH